MTITTDFMIVDQKIRGKMVFLPDNPLEGYLVRSFEVRTACQNHNYLKYYDFKLISIINIA